MTPEAEHYDEFKSPKITLWKLTRAEIEHENTLTHYRTTWLLSSQGFLFAVFGVLITTWMKGEFKLNDYVAPIILLTISVYAIYLCLCLHDSLMRAQTQLEILQKHYKEMIDTLPECVVPLPSLHFWADTVPMRFGRADSIAGATLLVWVVMLAAASLLLSEKGRNIEASVGVAFCVAILVGWTKFKLKTRRNRLAKVQTASMKASGT